MEQMQRAFCFRHFLLVLKGEGELVVTELVLGGTQCNEMYIPYSQLTTNVSSKAMVSSGNAVAYLSNSSITNTPPCENYKSMNMYKNFIRVLLI